MKDLENWISRKLLCKIAKLTIFSAIILFSCQKDELKREAKVETKAVSEILATTAKASGDIIDLGNGISDHGHCWGFTANPTINDSKTSLGSSSRTGVYTSTLQNLEPVRLYHIRAYVKSNDEILYGSDLSFTTAATVPGAPTIGTATAGITQATVSFTAPASNGGSAITGYTVTSSPGNITGTGIASPITVTGLIYGTAYTFTVTATNFIGTGPVSASSNSVTPTATVPGAPTIGTAIAGNAQATVSFTEPTSNGGSAITGYTVTSSPGNITGAGTASPITVTGLTNGTAYTFTVTATNAVGTSPASASSNSVTPLSSLITDCDGNYYNTIVIGTQVWMQENLKTTKYNDGTAIPNVTDGIAWLALTTPAHCWYNNDAAANKAVYGALYNWYTVNTSKLCPIGWHVPTDAEWTTLTTFLGGESLAGGKLKEAGTAHWITPNSGATNETGFTALPGGYRGDNGTFDNFRSFGDWWSSTEYSTTDGLFRGIGYDGPALGSGNYVKRSGFSVRCVRDY